MPSCQKSFKKKLKGKRSDLKQILIHLKHNSSKCFRGLLFSVNRVTFCIEAKQKTQQAVFINVNKEEIFIALLNLTFQS